MQKIKRILSLVLDDIAEFFPYIFIFYLCSFLLSLFLESWKSFFNWGVFHLGVLFLGILSLLSARAKEFFSSVAAKAAFSKNKISKISRSTCYSNAKPVLATTGAATRGTGKVIAWVAAEMAFVKNGVLEIFVFVGYLAAKLALALKEIIVQGVRKVKSLKAKDRWAVGTIIVVLVYFVFRGMNLLDLSILIYGLVSVWFVLDGRIAAGVALIMLIQCPFWLILKKEVMAESVAIYVYYFLLIALMTQIREYYWVRKS